MSAPETDEPKLYVGPTFVPPYFYFRFRLYGHRDGRFYLILARTAQQSVLDGIHGVSSFKPCAYCRIVHRTDIFAIAQLSCFINYTCIA